MQGNTKVLHDVQFVPSLAYNLLSVGQLMRSGHRVVFDDDTCSIINKKSGQPMAIVQMTQNQVFPLDVTKDYKALTVSCDNEARLWHLRYGHLNVNGLRLLSRKEMVFGLPNIGEVGFCEGCVYGKQSRKSFPVASSWRASDCLELVHADLCGPMKAETFSGSRYFFLAY